MEFQPTTVCKHLFIPSGTGNRVSGDGRAKRNPTHRGDAVTHTHWAFVSLVSTCEATFRSRSEGRRPETWHNLLLSPTQLQSGSGGESRAFCP